MRNERGEEILPEGYKMTELGPLPKEWQVVRLGEVAEKPQYGFTAAAQRDPVGPKMLRITDIQDGNVNWNAVPYCECGNDDIPKYLLEAGDILFARTGSVGKAFLVSSVPEPSIFASYLIRVRVDRTRLDPQFAFLFMQSAAYWSQIASQTHGAVQPNVNATQLRSLLLPLPPLPEQRAIAHVLRTVQEAKEATERVIAALRELKKSLMQHLFTYGPVPVTERERVALQETEIGPLPAHWRVVRLGEIARVKYGKAKPINEHGNIPVIGSGGIYGWTAEAAVDFATLIIGRKGTAGQVWLSETPSWPSDTTFYLEWKSHTTVDVRFIYGWFLLNPLSGEHAKTTIPSLQRPDLENSLVPLPPLDEQRAIAETLRAVDRRIEAEESHKQALDALFRSLLHNLMTAKIRLSPDFIRQFASPNATGEKNHGPARRA
jgi:type I restriction enzyme S subunit